MNWLQEFNDPTLAGLLEQGRKHGLVGKLRRHLDYLWRSCSGNLATQSDLFRLTYALERLSPALCVPAPSLVFLTDFTG